eukprot:2875086-Prymnesium_polylepis.1
MLPTCHIPSTAATAPDTDVTLEGDTNPPERAGGLRRTVRCGAQGNADLGEQSCAVARWLHELGWVEEADALAREYAL